MSDAMPTCGECRFFRRVGEQLAEAGAPPTGICRRRSPGSKGWPGTRSLEWCGDWAAPDQGRVKSPLEVVLAKVDAVLAHLSLLDERLTAVEFSVTAAQFEIARKEL